MSKRQIHMRVICVDPMRYCPGVEALDFGLQDKQGILQAGEMISDHELAFEFSLSVAKYNDDRANFTGPFAQGPRTGRFVYLTYRSLEDDEWRIFRRLKVPLSAITWEQAASALSEDKTLQARVNGYGVGYGALAGWWLACRPLIAMGSALPAAIMFRLRPGWARRRQ